MAAILAYESEVSAWTECIEQINCDKSISTGIAHIMKISESKKGECCVRIQGKQKYVLLAGMTGFLLGICSANLWMKQYVLDIGILNQYFLEQYNRVDIVYEAYFWYLVKSRGTPFVLLLGAAGTATGKKRQLC